MIKILEEELNIKAPVISSQEIQQQVENLNFADNNIEDDITDDIDDSIEDNIDNNIGLMIPVKETY